MKTDEVARSRDSVIRTVWSGRVAGAWRTILVCVYLVVVPSRSLLPFWTYDEQRVWQVALIGVLVVVLAPWRASVRDVVVGLGRWRWVVVALMALGGMAALQAPDLVTAWLDIGLVVGWMIVGLTVAADVRERPGTTPWVLAGAAAVSLAYYAADLLTFPGVLDSASNLWQRGTAGGFPNQRHMNQYQVVLLPPAVALAAARVVPIWVRALVGSVGVVTWWMLFASGSRGGVLALVGAGCLAAFFRASARRTTKVLLGTGLVGLFVSLLTNSAVVAAEFASREAVTSSSGRAGLWRHAVGQALEHPVLGLGPGHLGHASRLTGLEHDHVVNHPHNLVLRFAAEWGLPAAGVVAALAMVAVSTLLISRSRSPLAGSTSSDVTEGLILALIAALGLSLLSGVFVTPVGSTAVAAVAGVVFAQHRPRFRDSTHQGWAPLWTGLCVGILWLIAAMSVLGPVLEVARATPQEREADVRGAARAQSGALGPRFWHQGLRGMDWEAEPDGLSSGAIRLSP